MQPFYTQQQELLKATVSELEVKLEMRSAKQRLSDLKAHGLVYGTDELKDTRWGARAETYRPASHIVREVTCDEQVSLF